MKKLKIISAFKYILIALSVISIFDIFYSLNNIKSKYNGNETSFSGIIQKINIDGNKITFEIKSLENLIIKYYANTVDELNNIRTNYKLGDTIYIEGTLKLPNKNTNFNLFNYKNYLLSKKIYYIVNADKIMVKNNNKLLYKIKNYLINKVNNVNNSYVKSFILGDTSDIDEDVLVSFQENGINHLFAISGMHISLLTVIIYKILKKTLNKEIIIFIIISIFLFFYLFLINFSPSAIRASMLFILINFCKLLNIKIKPIYLLILIFDILIIYNPYYIYNTGFIFSFLISFSLMLFNKIINNYNNYFVKVFMTSLISFLISIPILINNFFSINVLSIVFNVFFVPFVSLLVFPVSILVFIFPFLMLILDFLILILESFSLLFSNFDIFNIILPKCNIFILIFYYILIFYILYNFQNKKYKSLILIILMLIIHTNIRFFNNSIDITVLDVGQGDSLLINIPNNKTNILIDTGGNFNYNKEQWKKTKNYSITKNITIPYLKSIGIKKLDYLIITHGDYDHMGETINLVNNFKVEKVIFNCGEFNDLEQDLIKVLDNKKIPYYSCIKELNIDNNKLYFLNDKDYGNENDNSSVIYTEINNHKFLFMGDAGVEVEEELIEKFNLQNIDVLKVGHHGSKTSSSEEFINEINPKYSIISVGKNNRYGHPNDSVLDNLYDSKIYRTDQDGSIMFRIKNDNLTIETCTP